MNAIVMAMIPIVMTFDYLARNGWLPRLLKFTPEVLSVVVLIYVIVAGVRTRFRFVRPAYWFAFGTVIIVMLCGAVANSLDPGPLIAGVRSYIRPIPLFFLAAVYAFSEKQIKAHLIFVLLLCLPQFPIALEQRFFALWVGDRSGDYVAGTLLRSGVLSVFLISSICVLTAAFLRKRISLVPFLLFFVWLLAPTTINETKVTAILLPVGLLVVFIAASRPGARFKSAAIALTLLMIAGAIFVPIYDHFAAIKGGPRVAEFFTTEQFSRYVRKDADVGVEDVREVGRVDAVVQPIVEVSRDPASMVFGLGIGNASSSALGPQFNGRFYERYAPFLKSSASSFILELGMLGMLAVLALFVLIYRDSRAVAEADHGIKGVLALGMAGVAAVVAPAVFYASIDASVALSYLFWYFAGVVAAHRSRLMHS